MFIHFCNFRLIFYHRVELKETEVNLRTVKTYFGTLFNFTYTLQGFQGHQNFKHSEKLFYAIYTSWSPDISETR